MIAPKASWWRNNKKYFNHPLPCIKCGGEVGQFAAALREARQQTGREDCGHICSKCQSEKYQVKVA